MPKSAWPLRRPLILLAALVIVVGVVLGAFYAGRLSSESTGPAAQTAVDSPAVADLESSTREFVGAETQYLLAVGHGLPLLTAAEEAPGVGGSPEVEKLRTLLSQPLPEIPSELRALSAQRENGNPTGVLPAEALSAFVDKARKELPQSSLNSADDTLASRSVAYRDVAQELTKRTRALARATRAVEDLLPAAPSSH